MRPTCRVDHACEAAVYIAGVTSDLACDLAGLARGSGLSAFSRQQRDEAAALAVEAAGEFEFEQGGLHRRG
jgi:hypothetical protein